MPATEFFFFTSTSPDAKKRAFATALEAETAAKRYAKRVGYRIRLEAMIDGKRELLGDVWATRQVDLTWKGSEYL